MDQPFIGCSIKYLPESELVDAARTAVSINPLNAPFLGSLAKRFLERFGITSEPEPIHIAMWTQKCWPATGAHLTVGFMEQTPADLRNRILQHANRWSDYANVKFSWTQTDPQIRITREKSGYYSYLGTDLLRIAKNQETMCLQAFTMNTPESEYSRVVTHEFAHSLAAVHEHARREIVEELDPQKTEAYFQRTQGWTRAMVYSQILTPLDEQSIRGTPNAQATSIMTYSFPGEITRSGKPILGGTSITPEDGAYMGKLYPKATLPPSPPPSPPVPPSLTGEIATVFDFDKKVIIVKAPDGWATRLV